MSTQPEAVIFDLDGVLIDSEQVWDDARREFVTEQGGRWHERAQRDMMGMSSTEWSRYVNRELGVELPPQEISEQVVARLAGLYRERLPLLPGAREAVERLAKRWPLGLASSSNRELIDLVLESSGLATFFSVTVSSEEVAHGKPAPDVYLEAARAARRRTGSLRGDRGLAQRHSLRRRGGDACDRGPEPAFPAGRRRARHRHARRVLARGAHG